MLVRRKRYYRDQNNNPLGVVVAEGQPMLPPLSDPLVSVNIGWSLVNTESGDRFNYQLGNHIANARLNKTSSPNHMLAFLPLKYPLDTGSSYAFLEDVPEALHDTIIKCIDDIMYKINKGWK